MIGDVNLFMNADPDHPNSAEVEVRLAAQCFSAPHKSDNVGKDWVMSSRPLSSLGMNFCLGLVGLSESGCSRHSSLHILAQHEKHGSCCRHRHKSLWHACSLKCVEGVLQVDLCSGEMISPVGAVCACQTERAPKGDFEHFSYPHQDIPVFFVLGF